MKIQEVSQQTGLTKKTIRFYEAQGLLDPDKTELNGREYRTYSDEDVAQLLQIATLRRARFSVEEIRRIQETPQETTAIFRAYRERLRAEQRDLEQVLVVADAIGEEVLPSAEALIGKMEAVALAMPLPAADIHPHFRYIDDLEELMNMKKKHSNQTSQERRQKKMAALNAALYAGFSPQNAPSNSACGPKGATCDISTTQKIAAYNLLMNDRD